MTTSRRFHIDRLLGAGAYGTVYLAHDLDARVPKRVALKLLRSDARPTDIRRFQQEAELLARLDHPSLVRVHDLFLLEGRWCIEMDFVEGIDLGELLEIERQLPPWPALEIVRGVAEALAYAWAAVDDEGAPRNIQHRDIKPSNVLVGAGGSVKLVDFGIARVWEHGRPVQTTGTVPASPGFLAPERARGSRDFGPEADVFGLGATLYQALIGEPLLPPGAALELSVADAAAYQRLLDRRLELLRQMPGLPEQLPLLVADMCAFEPGARPTAADVARSAAHVLRGCPPDQDLATWCRAHLDRVRSAKTEPPSDERVGSKVTVSGDLSQGAALTAASAGLTQDLPVVSTATRVLRVLRARVKLVTTSVITLLMLVTGLWRDLAELVHLVRPDPTQAETVAQQATVNAASQPPPPAPSEERATPTVSPALAPPEGPSATAAPSDDTDRPEPAATQKTPRGDGARGKAPGGAREPSASPAPSPTATTPAASLKGTLTLRGAPFAEYSGPESGSVGTAGPVSLGAGSYVVSVHFANWSPPPQYTVEVRAGATTTLQCSDLKKSCTSSSR